MLHHIPELIIRKRNRGKVWHRMSKSEDYLDQLLKGVSPEDAGNVAVEEDASEENIFSNILAEFTDGASEENVEESILEEEAFDEEEIFGEDILDDDFLDEDFLKEFEMEMAKLEEESEETGNEEDVLSLFDDLDSILSGAKEKMGAEPELEEKPVMQEEAETVTEEGDDALAALLGMENSAPVEEPEMGEENSFTDLFAEDVSDSVEEAPQEDADVLKILEGLEGIDLELDDEEGLGTDNNQQDFSALEGFLAASAADTSSEFLDMGVDNSVSEEVSEVESKESKDKKKGKKEKKASEKTGFMNKLGLILFGEDDDEEEEEAKSKKKGVATSDPAEQRNVTIGVASEEDLALFGEYSGTSASAGGEVKEEKKGKKDKKEKKKKEKKEKVKKEKKPRPKKEKKPKPPKEPDNTPPLPKKPVILIFVMVASLVALIVMGADLLGYSNQMTNAKNQYAKKNYSEAFAEISGIEVKEDDLALYNKYHVMAMVSVELEAYESLMSQDLYDMALDCLVRTVGRAEKYREDAEIYGCIQELNELELEAEQILSETFGVSKEEALEFYAYTSKEEYSIALKNVIKELGLKKVTE